MSDGGPAAGEDVDGDGAPAAARAPSPWSRRLRRAAPALFVLVVFVGVLPRLADFGDVRSAIAGLSGRDYAILAIAALLNIATFAPPWMAALPGISFGQSLSVSMAATALSNSVPGGDAVGPALTFGVMRGWGFSRTAITLALLLTGACNQLVNVGFPVAAVVLLAVTGEAGGALGLLAAIGVGVLVLVVAAIVLALRDERSTRRIGDAAGRAATWVLRPLRRGPVEGLGETVVQGRRDSLELLRRRWHVITLATIVGHLTVYLVLLAAVRAVDIPASRLTAIEVFASWSLIRLLTAVPITPGGLGVVELGLTGALVGFGGPRADVVAAVLIYRALTFLPPIPLGALCALAFRRQGRREGDR